MMLTDLADVLRAGGLNVVEQPGWQSRSNDGNAFAGVQGILCHWTGTALSAQGNYPSLNIVTFGRSDLPGMLSQLGLGRDGTWYVIGAGVAWHAGQVDRIASDNYHAIGVEAEYHPDQGAWPEAQQRSYERGCAVLAAHYGVPLDQIRGHYEAATPYGRKPDPNTLPGGMPGFRQRVSAVDLNVHPEEDDDMALAIGEWAAGTDQKHTLTFPTVNNKNGNPGGAFGITIGWQPAHIKMIQFIKGNKVYLQEIADFTLYADSRMWWFLPEGTDQISIHFDAGHPVAWSLERY